MSAATVRQVSATAGSGRRYTATSSGYLHAQSPGPEQTIISRSRATYTGTTRTRLSGKSLGRLARLASLVLIALVAACSAPATPEPAATPEFNLAHVRTTWIEDCTTTHDVTDEEFCADVNLSAMTADLSTLNVPTNLGPNARDRGVEICNTMTFSHFDAEGIDLGYFAVYVTAKDGGYLATCSV